ncbi:MAG TPA: ParM/StbA family protein [Balneolales bacterium]|nr:ParM/StbA family protein [Balneolales bacterium]
MIKSVIFPSVIETHNSELSNVSENLINGLKVIHEKEGYLLGDLALTEGISPHKNVNSSPDDLDYRLLSKAGLLLSYNDKNEPITLTTGFPFSTYQLFRNQAVDLLSNEHIINYDTSTFSGGGKRQLTVRVNKVDVLPEIAGSIIGLRKGDQQAKGNFFVASLGYGTFETVLSTEKGIIQRTAISVNGIRYALNNLIKELNKNNYLGLKTEHQLDAGLRNGFMILNRRKLDLKPLRKEVLTNYYKDIISPALRKAYSDADFEKSQKLYLTGGGALYSEIIDCFKDEFDGILDMEVVDDPQTLASKGYCYNSLHLNGGDRSTAVGIDIGNYQTVVSTFDDDM